MKFLETGLAGALLIEPQRLEDERGFFARTWDRDAWAERGLDPRLVQCDISYNLRAGTLRGMHFQVAPYEQPKLVRCTSGSIYDVIVDVRPASATFKQWFGVELDALNRSMLYVPAGFAHGFLTLEDSTEVAYQMSEAYAAGHSSGVRWDDPAFAIRWPALVAVINDRDRTYPDYAAEAKVGAS